MLQAQDEPWLSFPDTLWPCGTATTTHIDRIDSPMVVLEELPELDARSVMMNGAWYGGRHALALPTDEGVELLPLLGDESVDEVRVPPMKLLGNGRAQAVATEQPHPEASLQRGIEGHRLPEFSQHHDLRDHIPVVYHGRVCSGMTR